MCFQLYYFFIFLKRITKMKKFNPYHLVDVSPWPFLGSLRFLSFFLGVIIIIRVYDFSYFLLGVWILLILRFLWGKDINRERCYIGSHTLEVVLGFKIGIIVFILSECFFFFRMFWGYLHLAQSPCLELGGVWPPIGVNSFDPKGVPFLNTLFLVSSGVRVTLSHHRMEVGDYNTSINSLIITVLLGVVFSLCQGIEYYIAGFTFSCSSYSSIYFIGTGFHGLHVIIGRVLLIISLRRFISIFVRVSRRVGFECSVWYWHFVDVVWFFLYFVFYWWGV